MMTISDSLPPTKARALTDLLVTIFTRDELRQLILLYFGKQIATQISWNGSRAAVALAAAETLNRHGLVNDQLFDHLRELRPHHRDVTRVEQFLSKSVVGASSSSDPSQSDCLYRVSRTETERAAVFRFAESVAYVIYLATTGLLMLLQDLEVAEIQFLAVVACVALAGGYGMSVYRLKLHRRVASYISKQTSVTPRLTAKRRPGNDLLGRDRYRFLEYTAICGLLTLALFATYEGIVSCCPLSTTVVRCLVGVVMLLFGLGVFRAARRPLLNYVDHIADQRIKVQGRITCRGGRTNSLAGQPRSPNRARIRALEIIDLDLEATS